MTAELSQALAFSREGLFLSIHSAHLGSEINTDRYCIIIFTGKSILDIFSILGNAQYQFAFVMKFVSEFGVRKAYVPVTMRSWVS